MMLHLYFEFGILLLVAKTSGRLRKSIDDIDRKIILKYC